MKKKRRSVLFYDLFMEATSRAEVAPQPLSVKRAFQLIAMLPENARSISKARGAITIYVSDFELTDKYAKVLINRSDCGIPDPVFTAPKKGTRRTAAKNVEEGQDFSAHVVIKFPDGPGAALMLLEQCSGIGVTVILMLFTRILRLARDKAPNDFRQMHPDGSIGADGAPRTYQVVHLIKADGHPSDTFIADLNAGEVQTLEMVTRNLKGGFDSSGYFVEEKETITLKPSISIKRPVKLATHLLDVVSGKKKDFSRATVRFKLPSGEIRSVDIDPDIGVPDTYVKKQQLEGFSSDLESSYEKFHPEIIGKMAYLASRS